MPAIHSSPFSPCSERLSYSVAEAAKICGIGRTMFYSLVNQGRLPIVKLRGRTLVKRSDLEKFVRELPAN